MRTIVSRLPVSVRITVHAVFVNGKRQEGDT